MNTLMFDTYTIFWRELKRYKKSRSGVLIRLIQPAIWIIVIGNTFSGTQPLIQSVGFEGEYIEFMAPGVIILTAIFTSIFGGVNTLWDRRYGFMNKALTSPVSRSAIALGKNVCHLFDCSITGKLDPGNCFSNWSYFPKSCYDHTNYGNCNFILSWVFWNLCYGGSYCKVTRNLLGRDQFSRNASVYAQSCLVSIGIASKLAGSDCKTESCHLYCFTGT